MPNIAFFGTPDLTIPILDEMEKAGMVPSLVVTGKDVAKGRHLATAKPAPKIWAETRGIPVLQPEKIDGQFLEEFAKHSIELGIVAAYGKILPQALLDMPKFGMINIHYSLLPKYRGATPVEAAILNGDAETGVTIQKMAFKLDAGDIIAESKTLIGEAETAPELRARLNSIGKKLLIETIPKIADGSAQHAKQDEAAATRCGKITKEDGLIDPASDGLMNWRKFRAYSGWPGTYFFTEKNGKRIRLIVKEAVFEEGKFIIRKIVPEGRKEISYTEFLRNS